jgi:hypothetical protein
MNMEDLRMLFAQVASTSGFPQHLIEKDYWLTRILSKVGYLSPDLVFKGGTCLNKIYFDYFRLSEDLDFIMLLPEGKITKGIRSKLMKPIKDKLHDFAESLSLTIDDVAKAGRNESKQYVFTFHYDSVVMPKRGDIKFEVSLRTNPLMPIVKKTVCHKFFNPFTNRPLFDAGEIQCLNLDEAVAEKLRAASTRMTIAPRDFYDLDFLSRQGVHFGTSNIRRLFSEKLKEDAKDDDINHYLINLGRSNTELAEMGSRIKDELLSVLTPNESKNFNLADALARINANMTLSNR